MPLAGLGHVRVLDLNENSISDISSLKALPRLEVLRLAENDLMEIDALLTLPALRIVEVWGNPLSATALQHVETLQKRGVEVQN